MENTFEKFNEIETTQGNLEKQKLLKNLLEHKELEDYIRLVFEDKQYGLSRRSFDKVFIEYEKAEDVGGLVFIHNLNSDSDQKDITLEQLKDYLNTLYKTSGNEQLKELKKLETFLPYTAKYIARLLVHNLHNGLSVKSVNKVFTQLNLKPIEKFEVQLCGKVEDLNEWTDFPCMVGIKLDGFRCIAEKKNNKVILTSRQGKVVNEYLPEIVNMLKTINNDFILDGEIMADNFNLIQKRIGRKAESIEPIESLKYTVFDILEYNNKDYKNLTQQERSENLRLNFKEENLLKFEELYKCEDLDHLKKIYKMAIDRKEEGIVIKYMDRPYDYGSRKNWLKVKPIFENSFEVTGFELGTGKYKDTIGALKIKSKNGVIVSKVGSGLDDDSRMILLDLSTRNELIGKIVEVKYNEISKDKNGNKSLRFPRYIKLRTDLKEADEIDKE